jgi:hypothetical protein
MVRARINHKEKYDISPSFWREYKTRGFELNADQGGKFLKSYITNKVSCVRSGIYEIRPKTGRKMTFVAGNIFIKTINQIESMVKYKLFQ